MSKLATVCVVLLLAVPAFAGYAGTIWVSDSYGTTSGGEFVAHPSGNWSAHRIGVSAPLYETFCVEKNEYLNFGQTYTFQADIDTYVVKGGVDGNPVLNPKTAWLYCRFITQNLDGYTYSVLPNDSARVASANALQNVIWYYEGEIGNYLSGLTAGEQALATQYYDAAEAANPLDIGCTRVVNLWRTDNPWGWGVPNDALDRFEYQSLLICVPAPGAGLLGVVGIGLVGWVKRRMS